MPPPKCNSSLKDWAFARAGTRKYFPNACSLFIIITHDDTAQRILALLGFKISVWLGAAQSSGDPLFISHLGKPEVSRAVADADSHLRLGLCTVQFPFSPPNSDPTRILHTCVASLAMSHPDSHDSDLKALVTIMAYADLETHFVPAAKHLGLDRSSL